MGSQSHYRTQALDRPQPICPACGKTAQEKSTRYGLRSHCCGLWSWDRYPLVDAATHEARKAAHAAFDPLWRSKTPIMSRGNAYRELRQQLGLSKADCHIKLMDRETAELVPAAVERIREEAQTHD